MSKNWLRKDFDYLVGRRLERHPPHFSNRRQKKSSADRPQHIPHLQRCRLGNSKCDGKNLQQKCSENRRHVKYTFTNQPFNSRLTLEPKLEILGSNKVLDYDDIQLGWNPGIFANTKFVRSKDRHKQKDKIVERKFHVKSFADCITESPIRYSPVVKSKDRQFHRLTTMIEPVEENSDNLNSNDLNFHKEVNLSLQKNMDKVESNLHLPDDYSIISSEDNLSQFMFTIPDVETISFEIDTSNDNNDEIPSKPCKHLTDIVPNYYFQDDPYFQDQYNYNRQRIRYLSSVDTPNFQTNNNNAHFFYIY